MALWLDRCLQMVRMWFEEPTISLGKVRAWDCKFNLVCLRNTLWSLICSATEGIYQWISNCVLHPHNSRMVLSLGISINLFRFDC